LKGWENWSSYKLGAHPWAKTLSNLGMMSFKYPIKEHARKGMMVQTFQNEILKSNHLLFDELFK